MGIRNEQAHQAASMYYEQGLTMDAVARRLDTSRSSVSRLLTYARDSGIVTIKIAPPEAEPGSLSSEFERIFGVRTQIVPTLNVDSAATRLNSVAAVAASRFTNMVDEGMTIGVAWGNTTGAVIKHLAPQPKLGSTVVQLNGAANALDTGTLYVDSFISAIATAFNSSATHFPVPAFFDYVETKEALWRERSIRRVLRVIESCDIALFGVGAVAPTMPSHVYSGGFLKREELDAARKDGVVGDVCTVLIREDGSTDMELNARASGPSPEQLRKIPLRLCVVSGSAKAAPLIGALRAGVATDLVIDSGAARETLNRLRGRARRFSDIPPCEIARKLREQPPDMNDH